MSKRARDAIIAQLRKMVITGELAPGTLVSEGHLADLLECGRTPLREAVQQLSADYLLESAPRRGIMIPALSIVDFREVHEAVLMNYSMWIGIAVERITDQQLEHLDDTIAEQERCATQGDFYGVTELDARFHIAIVEATGNRYLVDCARKLQNCAARFAYRMYVVGGSASLPIEEHRKILEGLEGRDAHLAKLGVREHSIRSAERCMDLLAGVPGRRMNTHEG